METKYLETVLAVAKYRSFSRAAEEIPCSQASVSRQIGAVERELGYALFERSTRIGSIQPTEKGEEALEQIRAIVEQYNELTGASTRERGSYRLGVFAGPFGLSGNSMILSTIYIKHPELRVSVRDVKRSRVLEELSRLKIDGALIYKAYLRSEQPENSLSFTQGGFSYRFLKTQYPIIAFPQNHPLGDRDSVSFEELRDETFLLNYDIVHQEIRPEDMAHRGLLVSCRAAGFTPKVACLDISGTNLVNIRDVAITEQGWIYPTFRPQVLCRDSSIRFVPIRDPLYYAQYYFVTLDGRPDQGGEKIADCLAEILRM